MFLNASIEVILLIYQSLERICTQNEGGRVCLFQWCNWKKESSVHLKYYTSENVFVSDTYRLMTLLFEKHTCLTCYSSLSIASYPF